MDVDSKGTARPLNGEHVSGGNKIIMMGNGLRISCLTKIMIIIMKKDKDDDNENEIIVTDYRF